MRWSGRSPETSRTGPKRGVRGNVVWTAWTGWTAWTAWTAWTTGVALVVLALAPLPAAATEPDPLDASAFARLVWHAESLDGSVVASRHADRELNPASVVKVATTLWALDRLGPGRRFDTRFLSDAPLDEETGALTGDLHVLGSGDPDFHVENAFGIARRLRAAGVREVGGRLAVNSLFWIGWEGGSEKRLSDPTRRAELMCTRLRAALDPHRWTRRTQRAWARFAERRGLDPKSPYRVRVVGGCGVEENAPGGARELALHRSKPLVDVLRRFNAYSNNDIERLEVSLGRPADLARALRERWSEDDPVASEIHLDSTSGLGVNRMTPRQIVRLVRDLRGAARDHGMDERDLLPTAGCGPGTLTDFFPRLSENGRAGAVTGKTGTLVYTDGGVSILAGIARTVEGDVLFAVALPRAGRATHWGRNLAQRFVLEILRRGGGARPGRCEDHMPLPDEGAVVMAPEVATRAAERPGAHARPAP